MIEEIYNREYSEKIIIIDELTKWLNVERVTKSDVMRRKS